MCSARVLRSQERLDDGLRTADESQGRDDADSTQEPEQCDNVAGSASSRLRPAREEGICNRSGDQNEGVDEPVGRGVLACAPISTHRADEEYVETEVQK